MPSGQHHILVVDDDPSIRELLGEYLVENNLRVTTVASGAEMRRAFQESVIDLVVLDRNPLDDIRHSDSVRMVMINGRLLDASTLDESVTRDRKRPPFPWQ